jgi:hypothetical protein
MIEYTGIHMRTAKSFTIEADINEYVRITKGEQSASERVNEMLRRAMLEEQQERLEQEAASFFSDLRSAGRADTRAFQKASMRTLVRD